MSYTNGRRRRPKQNTTHDKFQTLRGMGVMRHDMDVFNARLRRGEIENADDIVRTQYIICGCGAEGCGFHSVLRRHDENARVMREEGLDPWCKAHWSQFPKS
jgi:hypothetical protein